MPATVAMSLHSNYHNEYMARIKRSAMSSRLAKSGGGVAGYVSYGHKEAHDALSFLEQLPPI